MSSLEVGLLVKKGLSKFLSTLYRISGVWYLCETIVLCMKFLTTLIFPNYFQHLNCLTISGKSMQWKPPINFGITKISVIFSNKWSTVGTVIFFEETTAHHSVGYNIPSSSDEDHWERLCTRKRFSASVFQIVQKRWLCFLKRKIPWIYENEILEC